MVELKLACLRFFLFWIFFSFFLLLIQGMLQGVSRRYHQKAYLTQGTWPYPLCSKQTTSSIPSPKTPMTSTGTTLSLEMRQESYSPTIRATSSLRHECFSLGDVEWRRLLLLGHPQRMPRVKADGPACNLWRFQRMARVARNLGWNSSEFRPAGNIFVFLCH